MAMITETRDVRDFDEVVVQGRGDLILEQGDVESVVIEADAAVMPHVKAAVEGRRLVLGLEHWWDHLLFPACAAALPRERGDGEARDDLRQRVGEGGGAAGRMN